MRCGAPVIDFRHIPSSGRPGVLVPERRCEHGDAGRVWNRRRLAFVSPRSRRPGPGNRWDFQQESQPLRTDVETPGTPFLNRIELRPYSRRRAGGPRLRPWIPAPRPLAGFLLLGARRFMRRAVGAPVCALGSNWRSRIEVNVLAPWAYLGPPGGAPSMQARSC